MSAELTTVYFVGSLGKAIGHHRVELDVKSPAEAIRAMEANTKGALGRYLRGPAANKYYRIAVQKKDNTIDPKEASNRTGRSTIYFIPTIRGRNSGWGKIIVGAVLIIIGAFTAVVGGGYLIGFGVSLLFGGVVQLLTPIPKGPTAAQEQAASTTFPGNAATVVQGAPVPIIYGRALATPIPISITVSNNDTSTTAAGTPGDPTTSTLDGGGVQYGN